MKFIGQYIQSFIARFRSDVYLEDIDTGTIASGGNLGLDSNNKIVKGTAPLGTLTALTVDEITIDGDTITASDDLNIVADGNDIAIDTDTFTIQSATTNRPFFKLKGTGNNANPLQFWIIKDKGAAGADGDEIGRIYFVGDDTIQTQTGYGEIKCTIEEADQTNEAGKLELRVANDGTLRNVITGTGIAATAAEVDVTIANGAASVTTIAGTLTMGSTASMTNAGLLSVANQTGITGVGTLVSGNATAVVSAASDTVAGKVELATTAEAVTGTDTGRAVTPAGLKARVSQIINLKGYTTSLQDGVYEYANPYNTDDEAPFQMQTSYGSGTIGSGTEVNQKTFFRSGGFHVPFACTVSTIQVQATINSATSTGGNIVVAIAEYRPSDLSGDQNDHPRTVYEEVTVLASDNANKVKSTTIATGDLDATAIPAGSHLILMIKGDSDTASATAIVSASIGLSW